MEALQEANYIEMSLDDVIRDMKAKKALEQENVENNTPFLRQPGSFQFNRRPYRAIQPRSYNRSNYVRHMAIKRLKRARRTLDLRHRLITIRADKEGLDLRWKIVAKMIVKLREQARMAQSRPVFHPFPQLENTHGPRSGPFGHFNGMPSYPKVDKSALSQVERLVGRLPSWMKTATASIVPGGTPAQPDHLRPASFGAPQMRTGFRVFPPPENNPGMSAQQHNFAAPNHVHPCCHGTPIAHNLYRTCRQPLPGAMPPLAYEPLPVVKQPVTTKPLRVGVIKNTQSEEDIEISVLNEDDDLTRGKTTIKQTLHERFTM